MVLAVWYCKPYMAAKCCAVRQCEVSKYWLKTGVSWCPGNILKMPPPPLLMSIILKFLGMYWFQSALLSYRKPMSPVIKTVGFWVVVAAPMAVDVLPSMPLVPRLQKTSMLGWIGNNCAYLMGELLLTCSWMFGGN